MAPPEPDHLKIRVNGETIRISPSTELQTGQTVGARYEVLSLLGRGGMGLVYKVKQIFLNKEFALKTIEKNCISEMAVRRFQQEARTTFALKHPGIIAVNDFGVLDDQTPFLVMELITGETLGDCLKRRVRLSLDEAIPIFVQVCFALAYAHDHGIVHRDIKPNNIMLLSGLPPGSDGSVKVLDFGIAKFVDHEGGEIQALTRTGEIFGSPLYMSPEQCSGARVDNRSDVYSLGCVFFETLTGASPFIGENALVTMMKHQSEKALTLKQASLGENFPKEIEDIVATMLAKSPEDRYQNLGVVAHDLGALLRGDAISSTATAVRIEERHSKPAKTNNQKNYALLLGTALIIAVIAGITGYCFNASQSKKAVQDSVPGLAPIAPPTPQIVELLPSDPFAMDSLSNAQKKGQAWSLQFPEKVSLGLLTLSSGKTCKAQGQVIIEPPLPLALAPSSYLCNRPKLFRLFRSNEVAELHFHPRDVEITDDVLLFINHLTALKALYLNKFDISDNGLAFLNRLESLEVLELSETKVSGKGLSTVNLLRLSKVKAEHIQKPKGLSAWLGNCAELQELYLSYDNLKDDDLANIAKCSKLELLHLNNNSSISDSGISKLVELKALKELEVADCNLSEKSVPYFQKMHLKFLSISPKGWSKQALKTLHSLFLDSDGRPNGSLRVPPEYEHLMP